MNITLDALVRDFVADANGRANLTISHELGRAYCASLLAKRFVILTGLSGSGKTKLAQAFARWITSGTTNTGQVFRPGRSIASDQKTYHVRASDSLAVEFSNHENDDEARFVTLPLTMIREWASYIHENRLPRSTPARAIREAVKEKSRYSSQLHSFETHLKAAAFALLEHEGATEPTYCVVPVGADWTGSENVVGYPDGLDPTRYVSTAALEVILSAKENERTPHFLVLDEMNLSHVERYFADVLSAIESDEPLRLHSDVTRTANGRQVPSVLDRLPSNLFVVGTVNVDETTYMFSPKVLDRANVIEFRVDESDMHRFVQGAKPVQMEAMDGAGARYGDCLLSSAREEIKLAAVVEESTRDELLVFFRIMAAHGVEFGYRTAYESLRFVQYFYRCGDETAAVEQQTDKAMDRVVLQKLLPKLHGSRTKLGPVLRRLWHLCTATDSAIRLSESDWQSAEPRKPVPADARYPASADKIARMWRLLQDNGFTSFAEA